jgi:branched-chain amino acid transport system substrate-binding protein
VRFTAFYDANRATTSQQTEFVRQYRTRFGTVPNHQAALSYDAAMLIGRAVHEVGGDRRKVREWIASTGKTRPPHIGLTGDIRFANSGDAVGKAVLIGKVGQ